MDVKLILKETLSPLPMLSTSAKQEAELETQPSGDS